jgi:Uri superfamily endonuclease
MTGISTIFGKESGTYVLVIQLVRAITIEIGKLGPVPFDAGYYIYTGSAFGPGGLAARVGRHLKCRKKCRWHIDYLRRFAEIKEIWYTLHPEKVECPWAEVIQQTRRAIIPCPGFGSSDCRCKAHLFHFEKKPAFRTFSKKVRAPVRVKQLCIKDPRRNQH